MPDKMTVLEEAAAVTSGPRREKYGHPRENFTKIATIWSVILGIPVTPEQVAPCMIGTKIARETNVPDRDNIVDIAGYARNIEMLNE